MWLYQGDPQTASVLTENTTTVIVLELHRNYATVVLTQMLQSYFTNPFTVLFFQCGIFLLRASVSSSFTQTHTLR